MEVGKLTVQVRNGTGKGVARRIRAQGLVPGVCYGAGVDTVFNIAVDPKALKASLDPVKKQNTVINVTLADEGKTVTEVTAMLWEYQIHPLRRTVTHVDLVSIDPSKELEVEVPIELVGKAIGAVDGGQIHVTRHEVTVRCTPAAIPVKFELDVTPLNIGDTLHIYDITFPEGVSPAISTKLSIATCVAPKAEVVEEEVLELAEGEVPAEGADAAKAAEGADAKPAADGGDKK
jgi:large subunit ribosomal protein L25